MLAPLGGYGHVLPCLAIAEAALAAGHEPAFIYHPDLAASAPDGAFVQMAGFPYFEAPSLEAPAELPGFTAPFRADAPPSFGFFRRDRVEDTLASFGRAIGEFRPDIVVADWQPLAAIAARSAGLPLVTIDRADLPPQSWRPMMTALGNRPSQRVGAIALSPFPAARWMWAMVGELARVTEALNHALASRGFASVRSVFDLLEGDVIVIPHTPRLDPRPATGRSRGRPVHHVGHLFRDRATEPPLANWVDCFSGDKRLIYLTLGTYYRDPALIRSVVDAFRGEGHRLIVTAPLIEVDERPAPTMEYRFADWLPAQSIAERADVIVHHGGHGTLLSGLAAGRPAVTFAAGAAGRDVYALRLAKLGASVHIPAGRVGGNEVRSAVDRVLANGQIADRARTLGAELSSLGGPAAAVRVIERTVESRVL